jgi:hypothetical protein
LISRSFPGGDTRLPALRTATGEMVDQQRREAGSARGIPE